MNLKLIAAGIKSEIYAYLSVYQIQLTNIILNHISIPLLYRISELSQRNSLSTEFGTCETRPCLYQLSIAKGIKTGIEQLITASNQQKQLLIFSRICITINRQLIVANINEGINTTINQPLVAVGLKERMNASIDQQLVAKGIIETIDHPLAAACIGALVVIVMLAVLWALFKGRITAFLIGQQIAAYQNDLMGKHVAEVENIYKQMRGWRHDYHNHIQTMKAHLALEQLSELDHYLGKLDDDLINVDTILKTGNVMVDAILNSKISLARTKKITINAKAAVPKALIVSEIDLCVMIGNLMDNAMEACLKIDDAKRRFIRVYIGKHRDMLYLSVQNASGGIVRKSGKVYLTTKDKAAHGFGLIRVDHLVNKYGGFINRQHEEGVFATEIMLPI